MDSKTKHVCIEFNESIAKKKQTKNEILWPHVLATVACRIVS